MGQYDFVPTILSRYASTSLFLYDILLTLDDEVAFVWSAKWTLPKLLYLWVRYPGFLSQLFTCIISVFPMSGEFCIGYNLWYSTWLYICAATTDGLVLLRVLALVKGKKRLRIALISVYTAVYVILLALLGYNYSGWATRSTSWPENLGCIQTMYVGGYPTMRIGAVLVPIATAPIIVLNIMILAGVLSVVLPLARQQKGLTPLVGVLLRDGLAYFVIVFAVSLVTAVTGLVYYDSPRAVSLGEPWFMTISPIAAGRLFLNLKSSMAKPEEAGIVIGLEPMPKRFETESGSTSWNTAIQSSSSTGQRSEGGVFEGTVAMV